MIRLLDQLSLFTGRDAWASAQACPRIEVTPVRAPEKGVRPPSVGEIGSLVCLAPNWMAWAGRPLLLEIDRGWLRARLPVRLRYTGRGRSDPWTPDGCDLRLGWDGWVPREDAESGYVLSPLYRPLTGAADRTDPIRAATDLVLRPAPDVNDVAPVPSRGSIGTAAAGGDIRALMEVLPGHVVALHFWIRDPQGEVKSRSFRVLDASADDHLLRVVGPGGIGVEAEIDGLRGVRDFGDHSIIDASRAGDEVFCLALHYRPAPTRTRRGRPARAEVEEVPWGSNDHSEEDEVDGD